MRELSLIPSDKKVTAERILLKIGIQLIINRQHVISGSQLVAGIDEAVNSAFPSMQN